MTLDTETFAGYYKALQLPPGSSPQQIHAQYRRLAKQHHPDRNPHRREWSEEQLRRLNEAYHALADAGVMPSAAPPPPIAMPQSPPLAPEQVLRPRAPHRVLRYLAAVGLVCGVSVAYSNWSQSLQMRPAPETSAALSLPPPAAPGGPPAGREQAALAAKFRVEGSGVKDSVARASLIVAQVNAQTQHSPLSRRPQKAELLAADTLELSRLQQSVRSGLNGLRTPTSHDLRRAQIADVQLALFQIRRQQHLVNAEVAAFPAK